ncbi:LOW QUALITY PROTEIN: predicted protein, partial [Mycobacterium tuberculosis T85]
SQSHPGVRVLASFVLGWDAAARGDPGQPALAGADLRRGEPELLSDGRLGQTYRGYLHSASDERYSRLPLRITCLRRAAGAKPCQPHLVDRRGSDQNGQATATGVRDPALHHRCGRRNRRSRSVFGADLDRVRPAARGGSHDHRGLWRGETTRRPALSGPVGATAGRATGPRLSRLRRTAAASQAPAGDARRQVGTGSEIERIALDVEHRINRATPVTPTAVVSLALLGADRSLSISEVLATVRPLASYIAARNWAVAGAADLTNRSTIRWTLHQMVASGVVSVYDAGTEAVWGIGEDQHLVAAFYRNTAIHILVDRAVAELALLAAAETTTNGSVSPATVRDEALSLRDLLKFEFLFSGRAQFEKDLANEVLLIGSVVDTSKPAAAADVWRLLESADVLLAHLVLRPFLDAYHIVADRLAAHEDDSFDEEGFLAECLQVGKQWELQRNIASAESRSMELFKTALRLARHRELVDGADATDIAKRRQQFADEIATATRRVNTIAELARRQ